MNICMPGPPAAAVCIAGRSTLKKKEIRKKELYLKFTAKVAQYAVEAEAIFKAHRRYYWSEISDIYSGED